MVHEAAHEEDATTARFEDVLGRQRIGQLPKLEAFTLVEHSHNQLRGHGERLEGELDRDPLTFVLVIAVLDGVDHRLADGDADPVGGVFVESAQPTHLIGDELDDIQHVEVTRQL